jgi:Protein of unknown function (DUF5672)
MLNLPTVTLVIQETRAHQLALLAAIDSIEKVNFAEVLIFTDRPLEFSSLTHICNPRIIAVPDWPDKLGWCRHIWFGAPRHVHTSHMLLQQWDAGVWDVGMWRDQYLAYDFAGAPWWHPNKNVGNSGFSLKSTRLARYVYDHRAEFPCTSHAEDDLLCRTYRPQLEDKGFVWAPENIAYDFAYEGCDGKPPIKHFGFHACWNFPFALDRDQVAERVELMMQSPYIRDSYMMKCFCEKHPGIIRDMIDRDQLQAAE